ncbi:MAG TPA: hypothetical protein VF615_16570 [Longimicrobiaceae bacterium]|jgi:hypothetical protein
MTSGSEPLRAAETSLTVEVLGEGPGAETIRSFVVPFWKRLRPAPPEPGLADIRLEQPANKQAPLVLHLHVPSHRQQLVEALLRESSEAAENVMLRLVPTPPDEAILGEPPLNSDGELVARFRACLAQSSEVYLAAMSTRCADESSYSDRQSAVLELILTALPAALPDTDGQRGYLAFHRDWLIRYPVLQSGHGRAKVAQVFDLLQAQVARMGTPGHWELAAASRFVVDGARASWTSCVHSLVKHLSTCEGDPRYQADPFAHGPLFPVLFRLLHAVARQFGVALLDEAFLHHLVLRAMDSDGAVDRFCLAPPLDRIPDLDFGPGKESGRSVEEGYAWRELVALSGAEGRAWSAKYEESEQAVGVVLERALRLLRKGNIEEGRALLRQVDEHRWQIRPELPGIFHVLGRFYHGEIAYYEYQLGNMAGAHRELDEAALSVQRAIETHDFLFPIAPLMVDIPLQKARIARRVRDWPAMERYLRSVYEMQVGDSPLCILTDGTVISYQFLEDRFKLLDLEERHRVVIEEKLGLRARLREFRHLGVKLYALPKLVHFTPTAGS